MRFFQRRSLRAGKDTDLNVADSEQGRRAYTNKMLAEISRELSDWVPILRRLADTEALRNLAASQNPEITAPVVRSIIDARRLRDDYFWPLMNETAWTLLLEVYANRLEGQRLNPARLSAAIAVPLASCQHWIDWLHGRGMIFLNARVQEGETALVDLTDSAADEMRAYLLASLRLSPWVQ